MHGVFEFCYSGCVVCFVFVDMVHHTNITRMMGVFIVVVVRSDSISRNITTNRIRSTRHGNHTTERRFQGMICDRDGGGIYGHSRTDIMVFLPYPFRGDHQGRRRQVVGGQQVVHIIAIQGQRGVMSSPAAIGTGLMQDTRAKPRLKQPKRRMLDAHGGDQAAH